MTENIGTRIARIAHVCMRSYVEAVQITSGFDDPTMLDRPNWNELDQRQRERYESISLKFLLLDNAELDHFTRLLMAAEDTDRVFQIPTPQTKAAFAVYLNMTLKIDEMLQHDELQEEDL